MSDSELHISFAFDHEVTTEDLRMCFPYLLQFGQAFSDLCLALELEYGTEVLGDLDTDDEEGVDVYIREATDDFSHAYIVISALWVERPAMIEEITVFCERFLTPAIQELPLDTRVTVALIA